MASRAISRFTTIAGIGVGLALTWAVSSHEAVGYPATAVSLGANPVVAKGGYAVASGTATPFTAPEDQSIVVTDVVLTIYGSKGSVEPCNNRLSLDTSAGTIAEFRLTSDTYHNGTYLQPTSVSHTYSSGLPLVPGDTLVVTNHGSHCDISYSLSGYLAQHP